MRTRGDSRCLDPKPNQFDRLGQASSPGGSASDSAAQLAAFLSQVQPVRDDANAQLAKIKAAGQSFNADDATSWGRTADAIQAADKQIIADGDKLAAIQPSGALAQAYQRYVASYGDRAALFDEMARDLRAKDVSAILAWGRRVRSPKPSATRSRQLRFGLR